jgi:hypothetical protein
MDGSGDAYQYLIQRLSEVLPDIADQVRQETGRGRVIAGSKLQTSDREVRETRMEQANAGRIGKSDILSVDYGDDERLALLIEALICLASTMQASRQAVVDLRGHLGTDTPLVFEEPDGADRIEVPLSRDIESLTVATAMVEQLLAPALEELARPS